MAVFIELVTDTLASYFEDNLASQTFGRSRAGSASARRPTRGLEIKSDTYAMLKVIGADGVEIPLLDSGRKDGVTDGATNFILQRVEENRAEKKQILETFGDSYVFFFGENPIMLACQAVLINSNDFNWEAEWWENYQRYLRGTKLVEMGARCYMFYDDTVVEGYMLMARATKTADQPLAVGLDFQFFVTAYSNVSLHNDPGMFPIRDSVLLPEGVNLTAGDSRQRLVTHLRDQALSAKRLEANDKHESPFDPWFKDSVVADIYSSGAFAADVDKYLFKLSPAQREQVVQNLIYVRGKPLRGRISENLDEYVGTPETEWPLYNSTEVTPDDPTARTMQEVEDLFRKSIEVLGCFGADINNPKAMTGLGLGVSFGVSAGVSLGGGVSAGASYGPQPNSGFGFGYGASVSYGAGVGVGNPQDPLGSVYGPSGSYRDPRYTQGAGDPSYGYASAYAGAGFGQAGFGAWGGAGFGSGMGPTGDPGFKDLSRFTYAGSADNRGAMERFLAEQGVTCGTEQYAEAGVDAQGNTYSRSGERQRCSSNKNSQLGGPISAFGIISVKGSLDITGNARSDPSKLSEALAATRFGRAAENPFGIKCLEKNSSGETIRESFKFP